MSKVWQTYADHILDVTEKIRHIQTLGRIADDDILYAATLRHLQTLSESTQHLPEELKAKYPHIPWRRISGFRNILVHNYLGDIEPLTVERVITTHLMPLSEVVKKMLNQA